MTARDAIRKYQERQRELRRLERRDAVETHLARFQARYQAEQEALRDKLRSFGMVVR